MLKQQNNKIRFLVLQSRVCFKIERSSSISYQVKEDLFELLKESYKKQRKFVDCWGLYEDIKGLYEYNNERDDINPVYVLQLKDLKNEDEDDIDNYHILAACIFDKKLQPVFVVPKDITQKSEQNEQIKKITNIVLEEIRHEKVKKIEEIIKSNDYLITLPAAEKLFGSVYKDFFSIKGITAFTFAIQCSSKEMAEYIFKNDQENVLIEIKANDRAIHKNLLELLIFCHEGNFDQQDKLCYLEQLFSNEVFGKKCLNAQAEKEAKLLFALCVYKGLNDEIIENRINDALKVLNFNNFNQDLKYHKFIYYAVAAGAVTAVDFLLKKDANLFIKDKHYEKNPVQLAGAALLHKNINIETELQKYKNITVLLKEKKAQIMHALFDAIENGESAVIKKIVEKYTTDKQCLLMCEKFSREKDQSKYYPLFFSIKHFHVINEKIVKDFYQLSPSINKSIKITHEQSKQAIKVNVWQFIIFSGSDDEALKKTLKRFLKIARSDINDDLKLIVDYIIEPNEATFEKIENRFASEKYSEKIAGYYLIEYLAAHVIVKLSNGGFLANTEDHHLHQIIKIIKEPIILEKTERWLTCILSNPGWGNSAFRNLLIRKSIENTQRKNINNLNNNSNQSKLLSYNGIFSGSNNSSSNNNNLSNNTGFFIEDSSSDSDSEENNNTFN